MTCSCEGKHVPFTNDEESACLTQRIRRKRVSIRCNCMARLEVSKKHEGLWVITRFVEVHNHHLLNQIQSQRLKLHRKIDNDSTTILKACNKVGIGSSAANALVRELNSGSDICFTRQDVRNSNSRSRHHLLSQDMDLAVDHLKKLHDINSDMYFAVRKDSKGTLKSLFWSDGWSRLDYRAFGDVLCFDTTYKTNKYNMPFALFVGINHHKQIVVFGCGLLGDETIDSFIWLFQQFKDAMGGHSPLSIITDEDAAIEASVEKVFPTSVHKYCLWHIMQKVPEKLGKKSNQIDEFQKAFNRLVYNDVSPQDFEAHWSSVLEEYGCLDHEWLQLLYSKRAKWVPVFHKRYRFHGMYTNQRDKGFHSFLDQYASRKTSLVEFLKHIEQAISRRREDEIDQDKHTQLAVLQRKTSFHFEQVFFDAYTYSNFVDIQQEMWESNAFKVKEIDVDGEEAIFHIAKSHEMHASRFVQFNRMKMCGRCSCMQFESIGIVCRHLFAVFWELKIPEVPEYFVLKRMSRNPRCGLRFESSMVNSLPTHRQEDLMAIWNSINAITGTHHRLFCHALEGSTRLLRELEELRKITMIKDGGPKDTLPSRNQEEFLRATFDNQRMSASRGCPKQCKKGQRMKSH